MTVSAPVKSSTSSAAAATKPRSHWLKSLALILVWQLIALLTVESVLFWIGMGEEDIYKLDKTLGFTHFPNKRVTWRSEGFSQSWFNADGMREPGLTIEKPAGVYRVALLGDSMVEGLQVPIDQTFGKLLEKKLNAEGKQSVQILNFANSGYSTAQEYLELKSKVFKYNPDLVILGYMSRDMFENWSPADQTITNVRPYALRLPGKELVVDSSPVLKWMRTPRAKFMMQIEWLRHYSRIWGLISATEMQLSLQDPTYKAISTFFQSPGKSIWHGWKAVRQFVSHPPSLIQLTATITAPSFNINFFEGNQKRSELVQSSITHAPRRIPRVKFVTAPQLHSADAKPSSNASVEQPSTANCQPSKGTSVRVAAPNGSQNQVSAQTKPVANAQNIDVSKAENGNATYVELMKRTMHSLIGEMRAQCNSNHAQFSVLIVPCRAQLSPTAGMETSFFNIKYTDEIAILSEICAQENIPMFNGEAAAETLEPTERPAMFFLMHLNAKGHEFIADKLYPFLNEQIQSHGH